MNLFYLHRDPKECAIQHCDKHVVKMIVESAQLLSTAHRVLDGKELVIDGKKTWIHPSSLYDDTLYKSSHVMHPTGIWMRQSREQYMYVWELTKALNDEFMYRYRHEADHSSIARLEKLLALPPRAIQNVGGFVEPPQCMPEDYRDPSSAIQGYRNFYIRDKIRFATYTRRPAPVWFRPFLEEWNHGTNFIYERG